MFIKLNLMTSLIAVLLLAGCTVETAAPGPPEIVESQDEDAADVETGSEAPQSEGGAMRVGPGSGMMARHHARVPEEYAGLQNPVPADEDSLSRGAEIYQEQCTACHGDGGMGDGPAGQQLDPPPAPVAHTSRMLGDDYLFWRISEGGAHEPFSSAMPRWQDVLNDTDRWDVINYIRALGSGQIMPGMGMGPRSGETFDPAAEAQRHAEMAVEGVVQGVLSQQEADTFVAVHAELDRLMADEMAMMSGSMATMQQEMLSMLVAEGVISQEEAELFSAAHEKLLEAGLMQ